MTINSNEPILILGIGNVLMGDEGIGARVAQFLSEKKLPDYVKCIDGGTGGMHLLGILQAQRRVILIDATIDGNDIGTIRRLEPKFSTDYPKTLTAHDIGLKDMLDAMYLTNNVPEIVLYAVSIGELNEVGTELSGGIQKLVEPIANQVLEEAALWNNRDL